MLYSLLFPYVDGYESRQSLCVDKSMDFGRETTKTICKNLKRIKRDS